MNTKNLNPGFYFDGTSNYAVVFAEVAFRACFPQRISCLSLETQTSRVVPLSSAHRKYFDREKLEVWVEEQIAKYQELEKMVRGGSIQPQNSQKFLKKQFYV